LTRAHPLDLWGISLGDGASRARTGDLLGATITVTPACADPIEYAVEPWPFRGDAVTAVYEGRRLEHRFLDEQAMRDALSRARWTVATRVTSEKPIRGSAIRHLAVPIVASRVLPPARSLLK